MAKTAEARSEVDQDASAETAPVNTEPLEYMLKVMNDPKADPARRDRMAVAAAPFLHPKRGENTKREDADTRADLAASGKFSTAEPPRLVVNNELDFFSR
jgi:phage terminase small subunit